MNLELAQLVSIACNGNAFLVARLDAQPAELLRTVPAFDRITKIKFVEREGIKSKATERTISDSTAAWFLHLKERKCKRVRIVAINWDREGLPQRAVVGFAGSGSWALLSEGTKGDTVWFPQYTDSGRGEALTFVSSSLEGPSPEASSEIDIAEENLKRALEIIIEYTKKENLGDNWVKIFESALSILTSDGESHTQMNALLPEGAYSRRARRLMAAASECWVFGGMGSWNDTGGGPMYERVSNALYETMIDAIITAVNEPQKRR